MVTTTLILQDKGWLSCSLSVDTTLDESPVEDMNAFASSSSATECQANKVMDDYSGAIQKIDAAKEMKFNACLFVAQQS